ncbi:MAG: AEC family transporter [Novosphingobium sp.]
MLNFIAALFPVVIAVAIGWFLAHRKIVPPEAMRPIEVLTYNLFFPAMIVSTLARAEFASAPWALVVTLIGAQFALGALGLLARAASRDGTPDPAAKGSIIQSNVRWNAFVALAIVSPLMGDRGVAILAIAAAALIPTANLLSLLAFARYSDRPKVMHAKALCLGMVKNPLVISCVIGGILGQANFPEGNVLDRTLGIFGAASIPLGLLAVGAGIDLSFLRQSGFRTIFWSVFRLVTMPLVALAAGIVLALPPMQITIAVIATSTPTAPSGYILARQLGGNGTLSANLIALQSLLSVFTMPLMFALVMAAVN